MQDLIVEYYVTDSVDNLSDHLPVTCILSLPVPYYKQSYPVRLSGYDWSKADVNSVSNSIR